MLSIDLVYDGRDADSGVLNFYDAAHALVGFQRSLALTTHLVINGEIITQAPSLRGARIIVTPPQEGSWRVSAAILAASGFYSLTTAPTDTPPGHLVHSVFDWAIREALGVPVDYDKTLQELYREGREQEEGALHIPQQSQVESLVEKCESAFREMHRPIVKSRSASQGSVVQHRNAELRAIGVPFTSSTYDNLLYAEKDMEPISVKGKVSSYNINTFKGRIYLSEEKRTLPFSSPKRPAPRQTSVR